MRSQLHRIVLIALASITVPAAHAQWAVVDVGAITQLLQQIATMREQLQTARDQLTQSRAAVEAMRGRRGMEQLLSGIERNYLPADWDEMERTINQTSGQYRALARQVERLLNANAVLSPQRMSRWSQGQRDDFIQSRRAVAALQVMSRQALATTSARFDSLDQLVRAIGTAADQKAVLDLSARIAAEQAMLQNDQTKLSMLHEAMRAEEAARQQRLREIAMDSVGSLRDQPLMDL